MPSKTKKNALPKPKSGDVLEALEMVRATLTMLRQSFGIAFMAGSIGAKVFPDDTALKEWCVQFDSVTDGLKKVHSGLLEVYASLQKSEG